MKGELDFLSLIMFVFYINIACVLGVGAEIFLDASSLN